MSDSRIKLAPILLEAFLVVFGVVLAFFANEWRQAQVDKSNAERAVVSIQEELEGNRAGVVQSLEYHVHLLDTLGTVMSSGGPDPDNRIFHRGFVDPAAMVTTAWNVAQATNVVGHMDYETVLAISRMYDDQENYEHQARLVGGILYDAMFQSGLREVYHNYRNLFSIIGTFYYRECELLQRYEEVLPDLGAEPTADALPTACHQVLAN